MHHVNSQIIFLLTLALLANGLGCTRANSSITSMNKADTNSRTPVRVELEIPDSLDPANADANYTEPLSQRLMDLEVGAIVSYDSNGDEKDVFVLGPENGN